MLSFACSKKTINEDNNNLDNPEYLYKVATIELDNQNLDIAKEKFQQIEFKYPLSNEAIQSQIMLAFIEYINMNYEEAIFKFDKVISLYPSHKNIDYAYYMRAMCYFEQIENEFLDGKYNIKSLESFEQLINRFPDSDYARDSEQKIILVKENIAAKHMNIGLFYLENKKYLAALKRFQIVVDNHFQSKFTPEALHRLVEIYYALGIKEEAIKNAAILGHNYPKSKWYRYSYKLVGPPKESKDEKKIFKNIFSFLTKDDE